MIKKLGDGVLQICLSETRSCVYILNIAEKRILIDTGSKSERQELFNILKELGVNPEDIDIVLLTHNHYDHSGNVAFFRNAKIYGSPEDFKSQIIFKNSLMSKHAVDIKFCKEHGIEILDINKLSLEAIKVIKTPGHTKGSVCFYLLKEKILFTGDTLFRGGFVGRTDFPNSSPNEMEKSLEKIKRVKYDILCPGHSY